MKHCCALSRVAGAFLLICAVSAAAEPYDDVRAAFVAGDLDTAETAIRALLAENPFDPDARLLEAEWLRQRGSLAEARARLVLLTEAFPSRPEPFNNLAAMAFDAGDLAAAESWLAKAVATDPAYRRVLENLDALRRARAASAYRELLPNAEADAAPAPLTTFDRFAVPGVCPAPDPTP
ncbi:MAG: tetratricopeptide repeat protein [Pseudomonadota bacterium]